MKTSFIYMFVAAVVLAILAYLQGGAASLVQGLAGGIKTVLISLPLIIIAMTVSGLIQVLISKEVIERWLGKESGIKGVLIAGLAGALIPGGPYVYYPLAVSFFAAGAEIGTVMAFILAKNLWSLTRIPFEMALIGPEITFVRIAVTVIFPVAVGMAANMLYSGFSPGLRERVASLQRARGETE